MNDAYLKIRKLIWFIYLPLMAVGQDYPVTPVPFTNVSFQDEFWASRLETSRAVTVPYCLQRCEDTGRIDNFAIAGGLQEGKYRGARYNDSDLYKVIEAAAYSLRVSPDQKLEEYVDSIIDKIAAAQEEDGYLSTLRTIGIDNVDPDDKPIIEMYGRERWSRMDHGHELYCVGHMYEAAVAYYQATDKRTLLDVAIRNADLIAAVFGPDKKRNVPGHQEIEIGLVRLYRLTGDVKYLNLAKFFLDERGHYNGRSVHSYQGSITYAQDHKPVIEQTEPTGHVVRALYMYSGMADIGAIIGDRDFIEAIDTIWENIISKKLYLTGSMGVQGYKEGFGEDYMLPNANAYNETCAAVANAMWNHRMFLLHEDAKYMDIVERVLYNGILSGVSLEGNSFFYPNPLASTGRGMGAERQPWFHTACCPSNISRFMPSVPGYVYAQKKDMIYVNLFIGSEGQISLPTGNVHLVQETNYPWEGDVRINVAPDRAQAFTLLIRIPGWARNEPVPSDLYRFADESSETFTIRVNGKKTRFKLADGYARIPRKWKKNDVVDIQFPMVVRKVLSHEQVKDNTGKLALQRGPIVYCAEGVDNDGHALDLVLDTEQKLYSEFHEDMLGGIVTITGEALREEADLSISKRTLTAIPYYAWAERGPSEMAVWLNRGLPETQLRPAETTLPKLSPGIRYEYYEGGWQSALPEFGDLTPAKSGIIEQFDLAERELDEYYAFKYSAYIDIPRDGKYTFFINSDDGSKLLIGDLELIDNDGHHGMVELSGQMALKAGKHPITILFFQANGGYGLEVKYTGPGIDKQIIPPGVLFTRE